MAVSYRDCSWPGCIKKISEEALKRIEYCGDHQLLLFQIKREFPEFRTLGNQEIVTRVEAIMSGTRCYTVADMRDRLQICLQDIALMAGENEDYQDYIRERWTRYGLKFERCGRFAVTTVGNLKQCLLRMIPKVTSVRMQRKIECILAHPLLANDTAYRTQLEQLPSFGIGIPNGCLEITEIARMAGYNDDWQSIRKTWQQAGFKIEKRGGRVFAKVGYVRDFAIKILSGNYRTQLKRRMLKLLSDPVFYADKRVQTLLCELGVERPA